MLKEKSQSLIFTFLSTLALAGVAATDSDVLRIKKAVLTLTSFIIATLAIFWGAAYVGLGLPVSGSIPLGYAVVSFTGMLFFYRNKNFEFFRFIQLVLILVLPFLLQWSLGGFSLSGVVMIWALLSPLAALFFGDIGYAFKWLVAFMVLTIISGLIDPFVAEQATVIMPPWVISAFYVLNIGFGSGTIFIVLRYFYEDRERARLAAINANNAKSEFLANMSHEIRTPLTAIIGFAESLHGQSNHLNGEQSGVVSAIERAGKHLLRIINEILDLSKVEANKLEVEHIRFSPFEVLTDVVSMVGIHAKEEGIVCNIEYHYPLPTYIESDPVRLKQILINLCNNAIKFTDNGIVKVVMDCLYDKRILRFQIIDTGIGMTAEQMERLFVPFSQADTSITRKYGGTGLGLYLSKQLAEKLGGGLSVQSTFGLGSCITIEIHMGSLDDFKMVDEFPQQLEAEQAQQTAHAQLPSEKLAGSVLLVEDNLENQKLITLYLRRFGLTPEIANNGSEAVNMAQNKPYDLILMDIQMPVMDGIAATRLLRKQAYRGTIVALTANALQEERQRCIAAGCDDLITKPVDWNILNKLLTDVLSSTACEDGKDTPVVSTLTHEEPQFAALVELFVAKLPGRIDGLQNALDTHDLATLKSDNHALKGVSGNLGFRDIVNITMQIEQEISRSGIDAISDLLTQLRALATRIEKGIAKTSF